MNHNHPLELISPSTDVSKIDASVIWLHGLGADGHDFEPVVLQLLQHQGLKNVRFILPHAPDMAITRNNGYVMPAWYDIYGNFPVTKEDEAGIQASQRYIETLIDNEIKRGIASERVVLAGFSQGGAIALYTALRFPQKLAAVLALSSYLPLQINLHIEADIANANTPIFMAHGIFDDVINLDIAKISLNLLQNCHYPVTWHEYDMAHSVSTKEITEIKDFLMQVLK